MEPVVPYSCGLLSLEEEVALLKKDYTLDLPSTYDKMCYSKKLRLRRILPHFVERNPMEVALEYFNTVLKAAIYSDNINEALYVKPWIGDGQDILVNFKSKWARQKVYNLRSVLNGGLFDVCDELFEEQVSIWKILLNRFGEASVITQHGGVSLFDDRSGYIIMSIDSLKEYFSSPEQLAQLAQPFVKKKALYKLIRLYFRN